MSKVGFYNKKKKKKYQNKLHVVTIKVFALNKQDNDQFDIGNI